MCCQGAVVCAVVFSVLVARLDGPAWTQTVALPQALHTPVRAMALLFIQLIRHTAQQRLVHINLDVCSVVVRVRHAVHTGRQWCCLSLQDVTACNQHPMQTEHHWWRVRHP